MTYQRDRTYSAHTQDIEHLIRVAAEVGARRLEVTDYKDFASLTSRTPHVHVHYVLAVEWDREGAVISKEIR